MSTVALRLTQVRKDLVSLLEIKNKMDPASGITAYVMRGVESDENQNQFVKVETGVHLDAILDALIAATKDSIAFNTSLAKSELNHLQSVLETTKEQ